MIPLSEICRDALVILLLMAFGVLWSKDFARRKPVETEIIPEEQDEE